MPILAGVDIGTLTFRLLIARIEADGRLHELASERRLVRLGEGLQSGARLQPAPIARALETLRSWRSVIAQARPSEVAVVATSAVRDAVNREEFLAQIQQVTGWQVEVISGEEEARRALLGIRAGLPSGVECFLALDIGGGSTEFMKVTPGTAPAIVSIDEGVVRLTEECLRSDPARGAEVEAARRRIESHWDLVESKVGSLDGYRLVGTAGTITTLAAMDQRLEVYAPRRIHNQRLTLEAVRRIFADLLPRTYAERRALIGLEPGRVDLILGGALILLAVMERFGFAECLVSDYGLREGILIDRWQKSLAHPSL